MGDKYWELECMGGDGCPGCDVTWSIVLPPTYLEYKLARRSEIVSQCGARHWGTCFLPRGFAVTVAWPHEHCVS
jgi:hypothetical protein